MRRAPFLTIALAAALILVGFQNCGQMLPNGLSTESSKGGEGYDGKPVYVNFGECSGQVSAKNKIEFSDSDMTSARITRQNCTDLAAPIPVDMSQVQISMQDFGAFVFGNDIFDLQRADLTKRKVTKRLCWSTGGGEKREAAVWFNGDALDLNNGLIPVLKGYVQRLSGPFTGKLGPISETQSAPSTFVYDVAADADGDAMNLTVDQASMTGVLNYTISGPNGDSQTGLAMQCYSQLEP
jgi:hypothetical protein